MHKSKTDHSKEALNCPQYKELMTVWFPRLLALSPTGIHYDLTVPIEERVRRWFEFHREFTTFCNQIQRTYVGRYCPIPMDPFDRAVHLVGKGALRNLRKRWKEEMERMGWPLCDTWTRPDNVSDSSISAPLWYAFRDAVEIYKNRNF